MDFHEQYSDNQENHKELIRKISLEKIPERKKSNIRRSILKELLHDRFDCAIPFEEMSNIIKFFLKEKQSVPSELTNFFNEIKAISVDSAEGNVLSSGFQYVDKLAIIKYNKPNAQMFDLLHEYIVGAILNKLRENAPYFSYVYGLLDCNAISNPTVGESLQLCDPYKGISSRHLLMEYVDGTTLDKLLNKGTLTQPELNKILHATFLAMHIANDKYGFCHYDFHSGNVMIRKLERSISLPFNIGNQVIYLNTRYVPTVIDYGFSRISFEGKTYHRDGVFEIGDNINTLKENHPIVDFYKLIFSVIWILCEAKTMTSSLTSYFLDLIKQASLKGIVHIRDGERITNLLKSANRNQPLPNPSALQYFYPSNLTDKSFLEISYLFGTTYDKPLSGPSKCDPMQIRMMIYGLDQKGNYDRTPCNAEQMPGKDVWGTTRSLFDCAKYYFDGAFNLIELPIGTSIYHGSAPLAYYNAKDPYGLDYYDRHKKPLSNEEVVSLKQGKDVIRIMKKNQPIGLSFYGDLAIAQHYSEEGKVVDGDSIFKCGRNCIHAYKVIKTLKLLDLSDPHNLKQLGNVMDPPIAFLLALYHGQPFSFQGEQIQPYDENAIKKCIEAYNSNFKNPQQQKLIETLNQGIQAWKSRLGDSTSLNASKDVNNILKFNSLNPIRRFISLNLDRQSMRYPDYMLPKILMDGLEKNGYQGYAYLPTPRENGSTRFGEIVIRHAGPSHLKRDLSNHHDWQYIDDRFIFGEFGKLYNDMKKYKTTNIDFHAGDLLEHSVWASLYMQMLFRDNHPAIQGIDQNMRNFLVATAFLHDIGKGGDFSYVYYDKQNHPHKGAEMITSKQYQTDKGTINLDQVFTQMGIPRDKIEMLAFLVKYHWDIGEVLRGCKDVNESCINKMFIRFSQICTESNVPNKKTSRQMFFALLYAVWTVDLMATQPYLAKNKMKNLTEKILDDPEFSGKYVNETLENLPFVSNLPKIHGGRDMYKIFKVQERGLKLRQGVLELISQNTPD